VSDEGIRVFAENLCNARKREGLTQKEVADRAGMSVADYDLLESALIDPYVQTVHSVADALGVTASFLMRGVR
jgi:transcriptional regulator with XRE-family HTH domain